MTEKSPTPPNRQEPLLDPAEDGDEPAFEWMKPAVGKRADSAAEGPAAEGHAAEGPDADVPAAKGPVARVPDDGTQPAGAQTAEAPATRQRQGRRAERLAAGTATAGSTETGGSTRTGTEGRSSAAGGSGGHGFDEPLPTSALQLRPPQEEVERRNAEREHAANAKPVAPRVWQVLLAVCYPVILLVLAVRAVTSPLFLWVEYNRPGFPGDGYGFNTDDRMTYGSYAVDYLSNWSGPRYLGDLVNRSGEKLFKDGEVSHMADVKAVILSAFGAGALLILLSLIAILYLRRRSTGGVRRGLFAGSIATLVIIIGLGVLAVLGWEQFFTEFHRIFFANGTWTFSLQDTLIRLFPAQFWVDAGIVIGALVLLAALLTLILTWPTRKRRGLPPRRATRTDESGDSKAGAGDRPGPNERDATGAQAATGEQAATGAQAAPKGRRFRRRNRAGESPASAGTDAAPDGGASSIDSRQASDTPAEPTTGSTAVRDSAS